MFNAGHRRVSPGRESVGSDLYTVLSYNPIEQTCDLAPASINQRGTLTAVPIAAGFGGAWELQQSHRPKVAGSVNPKTYGNVARGPRWGENYPIQPGDMCRVCYIGESMSDPVITEFVRWRGDLGVPWVANQVLSQPNDYTEATPIEEDEPVDRYDLLLPSGAWLRSSKKGSWTIATPPVDRARNFITLNADGSIKIKARGEKQYTIHLEFDPNKEQGRICVGSLEGGSYLEFKDGDITLRARKAIKLMGQRIDGNLKPQTSGALEVLSSTPSAAISTQQLSELVTQAAGEAVLQSSPGVAGKPGVVIVRPNRKSLISNLIANPAIDGGLRGRIQDLLLDPGQLKAGVLDGLAQLGRGGFDPMAIASGLTRLAGVDALSGGLPDLTGTLDLTAIASELGVPSWIAKGFQGSSLSLPSLPDLANVLGGLSDSALLSQVLQQAGSYAMGGGMSAIAARSLLDAGISELPSGLKNRINQLIDAVDEIPVATPKTGGGTDWKPTIAQRLGAHILRGNTLLGGPVNVFNLESLNGLGLSPEALGGIADVAGKIAGYMGNPHTLLEGELPAIVNSELGKLEAIPPEIRQLMAQSPELISNLPKLAIAALPELKDFTARLMWHEDRQWSPAEANLAALVQEAPPVVRDVLSKLPQPVFDALGSLPVDQLQSVMDNPIAALDKAGTQLLQSVFGNAAPGAGTFDMKVSRMAKFNTLPRPSERLKPVNTTSEFHLQTFATPIERVIEYGTLDMPDYWATPDGETTA
ncbi:hypothetical protein H6F43_04045 [Leptolyngbya sp. FACHB-36]|uniref:hypothetical protein n=1 Tax=Leptolyngbya sp. FACHB-36 TaxID=2692808 RepID=UPI00168127A0|nr:hypothetical protein [Leptolyngbya sp. FACHB-36]MBD2019354.1 hypothetical protein [Leptolyngbya sp. FACHB-36]